MKPYVPILLGTARDGRQSEHVANFVTDVLKKYDGFDIELFDVKDFVQPYTIAAWIENEEAQPWRDIAAKAAGFIFIIPEYNASFPGEFKLVFDQAYKQYFGKPVGVCTVSSGTRGGALVRQNLLPVWHKCKMTPVPVSVEFPNVEALFAGDGPDDEMRARVVKLADAIQKYL